jgi:predicted phosphoribosyltransferase
MIGDGVFVDRHDAGERLAEALAGDQEVLAGPGTVLGIPRGGVIVAAPIARRLGFPLDVVVPRKLGAPGNPELGIGAIAPLGIEVIDRAICRDLGVSEEYLATEIAAQRDEIRRRTRLYRGSRPDLDLHGRTAILVDDGIATGGTASAAVEWAHAAGAEAVVLAVPVAPPETAARLGARCTGWVVLETPRWFGSVGQWYERFDQVRDDEVVAAIAAAEDAP